MQAKKALVELTHFLKPQLLMAANINQDNNPHT